MNLVDYLLEKILQVINQPEIFEGLDDKTSKLKLVSEVITKIKNPKFLKINVIAEDFIVILKPVPESDEYFFVNIAKILVTNNFAKSKKQILNKNIVIMSKEDKPEQLKELFNEIYQVYLKDFTISIQRKEGPPKKITSPLEFNLMFQGICFENEYLYCYQNLGILFFIICIYIN